MSDRYVIIGASAAGISAAETLRAADPHGEIVLISNEERPLYSRPLISYYLAGELTKDRLAYRPADFFERHDVRTLLGRRAVDVDPEAKRVLLDGDEELEYGQLLIATGAAPKLPEVDGSDQDGVLGFRTLADAEAIMERLPQVRDAVVLGGGLVGLKAAVGLKTRGVNVTVSVGSPHLLSQIVDAEAAEIYRDLLEDRGIAVMTETRPAEIVGNGQVEGVRLTSGEELPAQLVVVGKGVNANLALVEGTDIRSDYGILIDEHCRSSVANVYVAGDAAQSYDVVREDYWTNQIWPCAVEQGRVAARNMAGLESVYQGSMGMNSIQFFDLPVISAGLAGLRERDHDDERVEHPSPQRYRRLVFQGDRIVGFVLVGDVESAGIIRQLVEKGVHVGAFKDRLLKEDLDFAEVMPLVEGHAERFVEPEHRELIETMQTVR